MNRDAESRWAAMAVWILITLFFGTALYLRCGPPIYDQVFAGGSVKLLTPDSYFYMRLVDSLVRNFPHTISFEPYLRFPYPAELGGLGGLFVYLLGVIIWLIGLGTPTQPVVDTVGAYFPAVLGALTVVPVYLIGKALFNRWAGVLAAGFLAFMPGEFLWRTRLGEVDRDPLEILLTVFTMLFWILAVKTAAQRQLTLAHWRQRNWAVIRGPFAYSLLAGLFLGLYLLTWIGAFTFIFVIVVFLIVQFIIDHLRGRLTDYLCMIGVLTFAVTSVMLLLPFSSSGSYVPLLLICTVTPLILYGVSRLMVKSRAKPVYYVLALLGLGLAGLAIIGVASPAMLKSMVGQFSVFFPDQTELQVTEMRPLLFPGGNLSLLPLWDNFALGSLLGIIALGILIGSVVKRGEADRTILLIWSLAILLAALSLRRFAPFLAVNVALLTSYLLWHVLRLTAFREAEHRSLQTKGKVLAKTHRGKRRYGGGFRVTAGQAYMVIMIVLVILVGYLPGISPARAVARDSRSYPPSGWDESLTWLKDNTPDPFGDPGFYYERYTTPFKYPESAYGVVAWWDFGYSIVRIAHRLPNCDPGGGARQSVASFFTAQDERSGDAAIRSLKSKYVMVDFRTVILFLYSVVTYAGRDPSEFRELYYQRNGSSLEPVLLFYPDYYRYLAVRLYSFAGKSVIPGQCAVISYETRTPEKADSYKEITSRRSFPTYEQATAYIAQQKKGNYRIASFDPFSSPVPLEGLNHYKLIYNSNNVEKKPDGGVVPSVRVFEYAE